MSKIEELIQEYCPDGVEFKYLWEVTAWDKKFNAVANHKQKKTHKYTYLLASALRKLAVEDGDVKLLSTGGEAYGWTNDKLAGENISSGEIVAIPWGGKATVQYYSGKFITADNRIATSLDTDNLDNKYLYYFMLSKLHTIQSFYRGSGIQHPSMSKVLDMRLPVPPLEVQKEIVKILDKFTQLEATLSAELELRRTQYAMYRRDLMIFSEKVETVKLHELIQFINAKPHEKLVDPQGDIILMTSKFVSTQGRSARRIKSEDVLTPAIADDIALVMSDLPNGRALARAYYIETSNKYAANQRVCLLRTLNTKRVLPKFLYYSVDRNKQLLKYDSGFDQTHLKKDWIMNMNIFIPSIAEQIKIVEIFDTFESLINSMSTGLPAEIAARRQQYEYYRNKLLAFKDLSI